MQPPVVVVPPSDDIVSVADLMVHCRIDANDSEGMSEVKTLLQSATSYLDGWRGILGRGVMLQRWSETFCGSGRHNLALINASNIKCVDASGNAVKGLLGADYRNNYVDIKDAPSGEIIVSYDVQMPLEQLPTVQHIVRLLVSHWFENREAVTLGKYIELPLGVNALINQVKAGRI